jgi:flagellar M-ring protein FliF
VRASVTLDYDPVSTEVTQETYDPNQTVTLSMQRSEQTAGGQQVAAGVPGTASNAPNSQALPVYPQQTTPPQSAKTETGTYGVSKTLKHTTENPGRVRRLTAAIVVNDRLLQPAVKGKTAVWQPRSAEEIRNLTALAQAAVGYDNGRGDTLTVEDLTFDENRAAPPVSPVVRVWNTAENSPVLVKYAAILSGILVVVAFGVRPSLRKIGSVQMAPVAVAGAPLSKDLPAQAASAPRIAPPVQPPFDPERQRAQEILDQVSVHVKRDPTQSSRLLQSWIHTD